MIKQIKDNNGILQITILIISFKDIKYRILGLDIGFLWIKIILIKRE